MPTTTTPDNLALTLMIRQRAPHLTPSQLAKATRIEDRRDTLGRKRSERVNRSPLTPSLMESLERLEPSAGQLEPPPAYSLVCDRLERHGLGALVPHLMAGLSIAQAAQAAGIPARSAQWKIAEIRGILLESLRD